ncbi:transporter substrate-binding domain-containing protein [Amphritea sp. 2_MG-2023]|jgi:polar amino acid transport system substrate-binding protein|uniref:transporter substrate-binding domain-containing protein n=1 Tax=Amphritea TaxID=515417 RepID=UPI001C074FA3|nr:MULTISPECIES: transporter substrate-binding domain-containing protein [Amphritea]MBU2965802.1 transporter substrate-binding domain-containing protein [Amphritea atlantica]MDO6417358.1 transporter substrate-binding domain-containing protein [Amphritea sp. 2_MG-2023]MDX2424493.1 transporter substrate-binding domain-containing protein [Amphritea sp.]
MKNFMSISLLAAALISPSLATAETCENETWNKIMTRGKLVVGVKADYKPWGYRNSGGEIIGMEPDLAADVAETMGVELELMPVVGSNRLQFLEQGQIDILIASMTDLPDRRKIVGIPSPNYYSSGTNILSPKKLGFTQWEELRGKPVCAVQGAYFNKLVENRYGAKISAFQGTAEARQALRDKKCVAFVFDDSGIMSSLASGQWDDFEMPLPTEDAASWGLAVPKAEENCVLGRFMSGMQFYWHREETLVELEKKWGIQSTSYLAEQADKYADHLLDK